MYASSFMKAHILEQQGSAISSYNTPSFQPHHLPFYTQCMLPYICMSIISEVFAQQKPKNEYLKKI